MPKTYTEINEKIRKFIYVRIEELQNDYQEALNTIHRRNMQIKELNKKTEEMKT